jgi:hypothetical protein
VPEPQDIHAVGAHAWDADERDGMINFSLGMEYNDIILVWKKKIDDSQQVLFKLKFQIERSNFRKKFLEFESR